AALLFVPDRMSDGAYRKDPAQSMFPFRSSRQNSRDSHHSLPLPYHSDYTACRQKSPPKLHFLSYL
ncbi:hypothetical protein, partial [Enterococcus faecalis]|uniref:hypothetical protein n=1 Tax=Enterococcus faecalis TaxID=1351 RepID=UPI0039889EE8